MCLGRNALLQLETLNGILWWFNPSRQLSPTQLLPHSPLVGQGRESEE